MSDQLLHDAPRSNVSTNVRHKPALCGCSPLRVHEAFDSVRSNLRTFEPSNRNGHNSTIADLADMLEIRPRSVIRACDN